MMFTISRKGGQPSNNCKIIAGKLLIIWSPIIYGHRTMSILPPNRTILRDARTTARTIV